MLSLNDVVITSNEKICSSKECFQIRLSNLKCNVIEQPLYISTEKKCNYEINWTFRGVSNHMYLNCSKHKGTIFVSTANDYISLVPTLTIMGFIVVAYSTIDIMFIRAACAYLSSIKTFDSKRIFVMLNQTSSIDSITDNKVFGEYTISLIFPPQCVYDNYNIDLVKQFYSICIFESQKQNLNVWEFYEQIKILNTTKLILITVEESTLDSSHLQLLVSFVNRV